MQTDDFKARIYWARALKRWLVVYHGSPGPRAYVATKKLADGLRVQVERYDGQVAYMGVVAVLDDYLAQSSLRVEQWNRIEESAEKQKDLTGA